MPLKLTVLQYAPNLPVRRVRSHGDIKWQGRLRFIGRAFVGQSVVLVARGSDHHAILFGSLLIGELHHKDTHGMRPAYWKRIPSRPLQL